MEHVVRIMRQKEDVATREGQRTKTGRGRAASGQKKESFSPWRWRCSSCRSEAEAGMEKGVDDRLQVEAAEKDGVRR